jgi:hypothetical protein
MKLQKPQEWNIPKSLKRGDEVILNHLRIGHAYYTLAHLMEKELPGVPFPTVVL